MFDDLSHFYLYVALGRQKKRDIDLQLLLAATDLHQNGSIHKVKLMPMHLLSINIVIGYLVFYPMHRYIVKVILVTLIAILSWCVAVVEQQLVKLLSIGSPDQLEIFAEVLLELAEDLLTPTVLLLL